MFSFRFMVVFLVFALLSSSFFIDARPTGSPKCRIVNIADLGKMPNTDGSAEGWVFTPSSTTYTPGQTMTFTITNNAGKTSFVGFLAFVEKPDATATNINQIGSFTGKTDATITGNFPSPCNNAATAITHSSATPKSLPYTLTWTAPAAGTGLVRARLAIMTDTTNFPFQFITIDLNESKSSAANHDQSGPAMIMMMGAMIAMVWTIRKIGF